MTDRIAALERENAKLRKINEVLMDRVERSMDFQGNAFSLFQTAILLEGKVRERTRELESALLELEAANLAAEEMRSFLREAIDSINEGFLLCDADDRVVLTNGRYRAMWMAGIGELEGDVSFETLIRRAALSGAVHDAAPDPEAWVKWRLANHRDPGEPVIIRMADGRWFQISERRTRDGGIVGLHTDITEIKLSEERRRERELAEKSILLQATLDNLTQGVSVFDGNHRLVAWNHRFVHLLKAPASLARAGAPLGGFGNLPAVRAQFSTPDEIPLVHEVETADQTVLEIRRNPMPGGGFVTTYTDITERKRSEEALRDSERRIRLVTDAMPAMIAYVDARRHYRFTNKGYEDWFGRPRSNIDGRSMIEVLGQDLYDLRAEYVERALAGEECSFEMMMPRGPAGTCYVLANYVPHFGPGGSVLGFFALIQDITERRLAAQQLVEAKESLERRVEERTRELTTAKAVADEANLSKTRFLAAASHDLLQPLSAARVFASVLTERRLAPRNRSLVHSTLAALDSVDELLTALLDISKLDAGVQQVDVCDFALSGVLATLAGEYAMVAKARALDLRLQNTGLAVRSDPRLLGRILRNYLSNALRYTPPGGRILMGCRRQGDAVMVGVWDSGPGIPADKLDEIFEEFRRLHPKVEGERGMGLGLAIVRRIARVLDHELVVRSRLGHGSLFGLRIPVVACPAPETPLTADTQPAAVSRLEGAVVVIVENDREILAAMRSLMENWGCHAVTGRSAAEAQAGLAADHLPPDLILADYHLDDGEIGLDAIAALRAAAGAPVPAVIITADYSDELQAQAEAADCHVLNKPVRRGKLRSLVAHLLSARVTSEG
ncbi:MAG: NahK/ErcS family hybrid sensor histidine kinase/response regulator [Bacteroidota bacterium]